MVTWRFFGRCGYTRVQLPRLYVDRGNRAPKIPKTALDMLEVWHKDMFHTINSPKHMQATLLVDVEAHFLKVIDDLFVFFIGKSNGIPPKSKEQKKMLISISMNNR